MLRLRFSILTAAFTGLACVIILAAPARAETISDWDFSTYTTSGADWHPSPLAPFASDSNATIIGLTRNWTLGSGSAAAYAWGGNNFSTTANTEALAIAANNFVTLSLTAQPGYTLSLSDIPAYNIRHSATGPLTGIWQYQVDSGSFVDIGGAIAWGSVTTSAGNAEPAIDLSGFSDLQNVAAGTTVTLRCVTWGATSTGGTWYFNEPTSHTTAPDLAVEGNVTVVPEPSALIVLAMGGLCLLPFVRRK
ncbi:MAG: hypothetical protein ABSE63_05880 [Thermoguttaceae bacterium]|jgi:hypothetical protein